MLSSTVNMADFKPIQGKGLTTTLNLKKFRSGKEENTNKYWPE